MNLTENDKKVPFQYSWDSVNSALIEPKGFREYDGRWLFPNEINLLGAEKLGQALGTLMHEQGCNNKIIVGCDFRDYSQSVTNALMIGLINAGIEVVFIGTVTTPIAYFSRVHLGIEAIAMVTASHNPNGWTGLKAGLRHPLTLDDNEMLRLKKITLNGPLITKSGGDFKRIENVADFYFDDICKFTLNNPLKVVCATGNGTAGRFVPKLLERIGIEVIPLHCEPDCRFPNYNPNPESIEMMDSIAGDVIETGADLGFGFDGDGDRLGIIDELGQFIFSDKLGLLFARTISQQNPNSSFIVDVKSTGLFLTDPELQARGIKTEYWMTGHSHIKKRLLETNATAAFEKSGHFYFAPPIGRGYDDPMIAVLEVCKLLDQNPNTKLSHLIESLPSNWITPTMSIYCSDEEKYETVARIQKKLESLKSNQKTLGGQQIVELNTINGVKCILANGSWTLIRASSNTPNLVLVCESLECEIEMHKIFHDMDTMIKSEKTVGQRYDQKI